MHAHVWAHAGAVVLDDVPRTAVDRLHSQHDPRGVQVAARSAAAARKQLSRTQVWLQEQAHTVRVGLTSSLARFCKAKALLAQKNWFG